MCQSPSRRGTHFYTKPGEFSKLTAEIVSIPFTSGNSFLQRGPTEGIHRHDVSVPFTSGNSFLPSPLFFVDFMRVSSHDFRGIFQTILKTAVFSVTSTFLSFFIKGQILRGTHFYKFCFLPVLAALFQTYGFISATQYDRRSILLTPCGFYSGDLLSLPRCVQQTIISSNVRWSSERFRRFGTLFRSHRANAGHGTRRVFLIQPSGRQHA